MSQTAAVVMNHVIESRELKCAGKIHFGMSDLLIEPTSHDRERGAPWSEYVQHVKPKFVILSTGAHVNKRYVDHNNSSETIVHAFERISETVRKDANRFPSVKVVWKTQYASGCKRGDDKYNWSFMKDFDNIIQNRWPESKILNVRMFNDVQHGHICGTDGVNDGTHYCVPGPLDAVPKLLLAFLHDGVARKVS